MDDILHMPIFSFSIKAAKKQVNIGAVKKHEAACARAVKGSEA